MPDSSSRDAHDIVSSGEQEQGSLLTAESHQDESAAPQRGPLRPSSIPQPSPTGTPRTPRTPNRVRFDIDEGSNRHNQSALSPEIEDEEWLEVEDYRQSRRSSTGQRAPLLTDMEAPSVTAALEFNAEDHLESARPKSGMSSAFMNMANSIIGAGIIGILCRKTLKVD